MTGVFYFQYMKRKWLLSFFAMLLMIFVMRWQGQTLVTEVSPRGIIDLEFARTTARLQQLQQAWSLKYLQLNILLDFVFIGAYTFFFVTTAIRIKKGRDWTRFGYAFVWLAFVAGLLDVVENILMYLAFTKSVGASSFNLIYYCALGKFNLIALLLLYFAISLFFRPKRI